MSGTIGSLLCTYVNVLMCVLKVPAVSCVSGCPSRVVLCISLNVLTCLCKVAHTKTEAWHTPMECSSYNVNMYQYIYKEAIFCMLFVYLDISKDNKKGILNPFVFCVPVWLLALCDKIKKQSYCCTRFIESKCWPQGAHRGLIILTVAHPQVMSVHLALTEVVDDMCTYRSRSFTCTDN